MVNSIQIPKEGGFRFHFISACIYEIFWMDVNVCIGWWVSVRWVTRIIKIIVPGKGYFSRKGVYFLDSLYWVIGGTCSLFGGRRLFVCYTLSVALPITFYLCRLFAVWQMSNSFLFRDRKDVVFLIDRLRCGRAFRSALRFAPCIADVHS